MKMMSELIGDEARTEHRNPNRETDVTFYDNSKCHFQILNLQHEYIFKCSISIHYTM